jgi:hypothetical protein
MENKDLFEVQENEGWEGFYPQWFATDGEEYERFDSEEDAQEYCDMRNQQVNEEGLIVPEDVNFG